MDEVDRELRQIWTRTRREVAERLAQFREVRQGEIERVFEELCFCLLTPQSSAIAAGRAISELAERSLLLDGAAPSIEAVLRRCGVRFPRNKSRYIVEARRLLDSSTHEGRILERILSSPGLDPIRLRDDLVKTVRGMGYKEASHFLRNIGYSGLAILDRHILRTLQAAGVIERVPTSLSRSTYLEIEERFKRYAQRLRIPPDCLDLVMWSAKTGFVYK